MKNVTSCAIAFLTVVAIAGSARPVVAGGPQSDGQQTRSPNDPSRYVKITWNDETLVSPGEPQKEVVGRDGTLTIDFDRDELKKAWGLNTSGALSIRGWVNERNMEIPGYSTVGDALKVMPLDLASASTLVTHRAPRSMPMTCTPPATWNTSRASKQR